MYCIVFRLNEFIYSHGCGHQMVTLIWRGLMC